MKKFSFLTFALLICESTMGQPALKTADATTHEANAGSIITPASDLMKNVMPYRQKSMQPVSQPGEACKATRLTRASAAAGLPGPDDAPPYIQDTPDGQFRQMVKGPCWGYAYNWMVGQIDAPGHGCIIDCYTSEDGKKMYLKPVYSLINNNCWLVGDIKGDEVVFTFPQVANHYEYPGEFGDTVAYDEYCLVVGFKEDGDGSGMGWYYPTEDQTFRFSLKEDGSLEAQNSEVLLGYCAWVNQLQDGTEVDPYWSWQYTGDSFTTLREEINKVAEVPETVEFEEWYLVGQIAARPLEIGFDSDKVYMRGLVSVEGIADSAIVGDWDAATSTISFPTGQFMGIYTDIRCESWFVAGTAELVQTEVGSAYQITPKDALVFSYDAGKKIMHTDDCFVLAQTLEAPAYLGYVNKPTIKYPDFSVEVKELLAPIITEFYPAEPEWGYPASMYVDIPMLDAEGNILIIENMYYNVLIDGEPWEFSADEYGLEEDMTDIPYTAAGYGNYFLYWLGDTEHSIEFSAEGYETVGVQYFYRQGERLISSPIAYAEPDMIQDVAEESPVVSIQRYTLDGLRAAKDAKGMLLEKTTRLDGTFSTRKVIVR